MRRLLYPSIIILLIISLISCGNSGTGPDPNEQTATYTVSVDMTPSDAGTVSPSTEDSYEEGKDIQLLANAADGYIFTGWTGDMEGEVNPLPLTVSQDFNLTANFELKNYDLTTAVEGEGAVQENVLEQKSTEFEHGTAVELIATPAKGYTFVEWKGNLEGSDNPAQMTVNDAKEVTAVFEKKSYELAVTTQGSGAISEQVVSKAKGYEYDDVVELMPGAAEGWQFVEWSGDLSGSDAPAQITVDTTKAVTAVFERKTFTLDPDVQGQGSIAKNPDKSEYTYGEKVTLTAQPADKWTFKEWAGEISGTTPEITVMVHSERDITVVFEEKPLFYLAKNGYTVVCPEAEPGQKGILNGEEYGKEYEAVDRATLVQKIENGEDVSSVCTSQITDMSQLLKYKDSFNSDISKWDVSNVTEMDSLFFYAHSFNQNLNSWDVSSVTDMSSMFQSANAFNQNINSWDVSSVTDMSGMFRSADVFNQDLNSWDVSSVTDMSGMFRRAVVFNQDLNSWDVSSVTDMSKMFQNAEVFNGYLSSWDVSNVTDMSKMFSRANAFDNSLFGWDVSSVTDMSGMFFHADSFDKNISSWDVSSVTDMSSMFWATGKFNEDINSWDVSSVTDMSGMFAYTDSFDGDISDWDVSSVEDMSGMFKNAEVFNGDLSSWNVGNVADMSAMFRGDSNTNSSFNGDISGWDVSSVTDMGYMFENADGFSGDLSDWSVPYICSEPDNFDSGAGSITHPNWSLLCLNP